MSAMSDDPRPVSSNERSLLDETAKLFRTMREEHVEHGSLSGRTQRAAEDLLRRIDSTLLLPSVNLQAPDAAEILRGMVRHNLSLAEYQAIGFAADLLEQSAPETRVQPVAWRWLIDSPFEPRVRWGFSESKVEGVNAEPLYLSPSPVETEPRLDPNRQWESDLEDRRSRMLATLRRMPAPAPPTAEELRASSELEIGGDDFARRPGDSGANTTPVTSAPSAAATVGADLSGKAKAHPVEVCEKLDQRGLHCQNPPGHEGDCDGMPF